jgi:hypothetical protein
VTVTVPDWARPTLSWLTRRFLDAELPPAAVEVRAGALGVVRVVRDKRAASLGAATSLELPAGTLKLSMAERNILAPEAFQQTLRAVLERAGVTGGRIGLVLPDPVARVALLPAAEVRARGRAEREEMIRFRLKKAVPFDIREAQVSFREVGAPGREPMILVVAILRSILEEYEGACRALGLEPGLVQLTGLTILDAVEESRPPADRVVVNWDEGYISILVSRFGSPALARTLTGTSASDPEQVVREATQTILYYRERLGGEGIAQAVVRSVGVLPAEAARILEQPLGVLPEILDPWGSLGAKEQEMAQALAGAAACVIGRAA